MNLGFKNIAIRVSIAVIVFSFCIQSCKEPQQPEKYATEWTEKMKTKIFKEVNQLPDKTTNDTIHHEITLYKNGNVLKHYYLTTQVDSNDRKINVYDTAMVIYYSTDQNFQFIQERCIQNKERSYEIVAYKGNRYGFAKYYYCKQRTTETGYQYNNLNVGTWTTYDSTGKVINKVDVGNTAQLLTMDTVAIIKQ